MGNDDGNIVQPNITEAKCDTMVRGNPDFDGITNTCIKVMCPKGCAQEKKHVVTGTSLFKDDSAICRAAVHASQIQDDKGGKIEVCLESGREDYLGSSSNGVESLSFNEKWDRSFVTATYDEPCPIDFFKKESSFLQVTTQTHFKSKSKSKIISESPIPEAAKTKFVQVKEEDDDDQSKIDTTSRAIAHIQDLLGDEVS